MKKLSLFIMLLSLIAGCNKEISDFQETAMEETIKIPEATIFSEGTDISKFIGTERMTYDKNPVVLKSGGAVIRFGVWYPYISNNGVPPVSVLANEGIQVEFITGDINDAVLANLDVLFLGRAGMIGNWPTGAGIITNIESLIQWINQGGSIISESESVIFDSDHFRNINWSSKLSRIAGVWSTNPYGSDWPTGNEIVYITNPNHPVTEGLGSSFQFFGYTSGEVGAFIDIQRNPTAEMVAQLGGMPVIAANYGNGHSVYFPIACGWNFIWSQNPEYTKLFINAIKWFGPKTLQVEIDIQPGENPNYFKNDGNGVLPVAIFGNEKFDVTQVDASTIFLEGMSVNQVGSKKLYQVHINDLNMDGFKDLIVQIDDIAGTFTKESETAMLKGKLLNGINFEGTDKIIIL